MTSPPPPPALTAEEEDARASPRSVAKASFGEARAVSSPPAAAKSAAECAPTSAVPFFQFPDAASTPPCPTPLISREGRRVLALDNDETTGYYQLASLLYAMHLHLVAAPPPQAVVLDLLRRGACRPGAVELIRLGASLKRAGRLDHLVLFTAASNATGWVTYLAGCLEAHAGVAAGTIDRVVCRQDVGPASFDPASGHLVKDLRLLCTDCSRVVIVDDKPHFVHSGSGGGAVLGVTAYEQHVPIEAEVGTIPCGPEGVALARAALAEDRLANKPPSDHDFSGDAELFAIAVKVDALFP